MKQEYNFKAGEYVVLLSSCNGNNCWASMPENYCYRLRRDSNQFYFYPELDAIGSASNGWSISNKSSTNNKLNLRLATIDEINTYNEIGHPFHICDTKTYIVEENYNYFIPILKELINTSK